MSDIKYFILKLEGLIVQSLTTIVEAKSTIKPVEDQKPQREELKIRFTCRECAGKKIICKCKRAAELAVIKGGKG